MKTFAAIAGLLVPLVSCIDFGEDITTEHPTDEQIQYCITVMRINPEIELVPTGLVIMASGIDDAIWFRFETPVKDPYAIFEEASFPRDSFRSNIVVNPPHQRPDWWDAGERQHNGWST